VFILRELALGRPVMHIAGGKIGMVRKRERRGRKGSGMAVRDSAQATIYYISES